MRCLPLQKFKKFYKQSRMHKQERAADFPAVSSRAVSDELCHWQFVLRRKSRQTYSLLVRCKLYSKMFCILLKQISRALNMELLRHYCHSGCLSCEHKLNALPPPPITGYHPECHTPTIEPEADSDSWICRQCVFAVSTKVRPLISQSHTWGKKHSVCNMGEIQSNTSGFAATIRLCTAENGFISRQKAH